MLIHLAHYDIKINKFKALIETKIFLILRKNIR